MPSDCHPNFQAWQPAARSGLRSCADFKIGETRSLLWLPSEPAGHRRSHGHPGRAGRPDRLWRYPAGPDPDGDRGAPQSWSRRSASPVTGAFHQAAFRHHGPGTTTKDLPHVHTAGPPSFRFLRPISGPTCGGDQRCPFPPRPALTGQAKSAPEPSRHHRNSKWHRGRSR